MTHSNPDAPATEAPMATPVLTSQGQILLRFRHDGKQPLAGKTSYQIRQELKSAIESIGAEFTHIVVAQGEHTMTLVSLTPQAGRALQDHAIVMMQAVADMANDLLEVENERFIPRVSEDRQNWLHQVTKLVVCTKKDNDWAAWRTPTLTPDQTKDLESKVRMGLGIALEQWGKKADVGLLKVIDAGRPMVISPAQGPRMLVRLGVKFVTNFSIEGALYIGPCNYLGMGRVLRIAPTSPVAQDTSVKQF